MKRVLRYVRIVFSATCLIACVLLIVLWVRSYWRNDVCSIGVHSSQELGFDSIWGELGLLTMPKTLGTNGWHVASYPIEPDTTFPILKEDMTPIDSTFGFRFIASANMSAAFIPYWFLTLLSAILATAPWLPRRFSLRTLLIATTLIAVVLGLIVAVLRWPTG